MMKGVQTTFGTAIFFVFLLDASATDFPNPFYHPTTVDEPFCVGGSLAPDWVLRAYALGLFPWFNEGEMIQWYCPDPRFVLYPNQLYVSKSMQQVMKRNVFSFTENQCFTDVMRACSMAKRKGQPGTWIHEDMINSYTTLHQMGVAKSIEAWQDGELVGGFYGVEMGSVFCGESMFAKVSNASKAAFIYFVKNMPNATHLSIANCTPTTSKALAQRIFPKKLICLHFGANSSAQFFYL